MEANRRSLIRVAALALAACGLPGLALAATRPVAYYQVGQGSHYAYLVEWKGPDKARVVNPNGAQPGGVSDNGTQKLVTLNAPLSATFDTVDSCDLPIQQRQDTHQLVVRDLQAGVSEMVEIGTLTNIGGCEDGLVTPFGSQNDPGTPMKRLPMKARPSMGDLVPGLQIAGPSEDPPWTPFGLTGAQDVITLGVGTATFQATGHSFPVSLSADQWLVFGLAGFERAYTRLELDAKTGGEAWLMADWSSGRATRVETALFVKPLAGAGFGSVAQASRMWESGLFIDSPVLRFSIHLYKNGTGERVQQNLETGDEFRSPISSWGFEGQSLVQRRVFDGGFSFDRTWAPLRNQGKVRWVMESELFVDNGDSFVNIAPRVNYYVDTGKAVPPAVR